MREVTYEGERFNYLRERLRECKDGKDYDNLCEWRYDELNGCGVGDRLVVRLESLLRNEAAEGQKVETAESNVRDSTRLHE